jgi:DNA-binding transcriptional MerR regulator/thioredoxin-like negative regulator of GroEL
VEQRFTRSEVERMTGATRKQLDYWARLRLVQPRSRWGERFFNFSDLVAVETLKRLTADRVPAQRLSRVVEALERQLGLLHAPLSSLRISVNGDQVVVRVPGMDGRSAEPPFEPLTGQFVMDFDTGGLQKKLHSLGPRTAEEWFELAMNLDNDPGTLAEAVDAYRRAIKAEPDWVEAQINLGTALFHMGRLEESRNAFCAAVKIDPRHALAHFNLGCICDRLGNLDQAAEEFRAALVCAPEMAEAHLNLALVYDKLNRKNDCMQYLASYLRYDPHGRWADFARGKLGSQRRARRTAAKVTPFRRARNE